MRGSAWIIVGAASLTLLIDPSLKFFRVIELGHYGVAVEDAAMQFVDGLLCRAMVESAGSGTYGTKMNRTYAKCGNLICEPDEDLPVLDVDI